MLADSYCRNWKERPPLTIPDTKGATHGDHEGDVLVVATEYLQLRAGRREDWLLDGLHQHVQDPELLLLPLIDEDEVRGGEVQSADR